MGLQQEGKRRVQRQAGGCWRGRRRWCERAPSRRSSLTSSTASLCPAPFCGTKSAAQRLADQWRQRFESVSVAKRALTAPHLHHRPNLHAPGGWPGVQRPPEARPGRVPFRGPQPDAAWRLPSFHVPRPNAECRGRRERLRLTTLAGRRCSTAPALGEPPRLPLMPMDVRETPVISGVHNALKIQQPLRARQTTRARSRHQLVGTQLAQVCGEAPHPLRQRWVFSSLGAVAHARCGAAVAPAHLLRRRGGGIQHSLGCGLGAAQHKEAGGEEQGDNMGWVIPRSRRMGQCLCSRRMHAPQPFTAAPHLRSR